jgi:hypothetical protein
MKAKKLTVQGNTRLLGPIIFTVEPVVSCYLGMPFKELKRRLHLHTGHYRSARQIQSLMHSFSREKVDLSQTEDEYCTEIFYFEISSELPNTLNVYACSFPVIFPDEDVSILREYQISF